MELVALLNLLADEIKVPSMQHYRAGSLKDHGLR